MPKVLIVFDAATRTPRRWVIPDHESELSLPGHVGPGEGTLIIETDDPDALGFEDVVSHLARHHGVDIADIPRR